MIFPDGICKHPSIAKDKDLFHLIDFDDGEKLNDSLIDFDFGEKLNDSPPLVYPEDYRGSLIDGRRVGGYMTGAP
jgi:hypothetical protein